MEEQALALAVYSLTVVIAIVGVLGKVVDRVWPNGQNVKMLALLQEMKIQEARQTEILEAFVISNVEVRDGVRKLVETHGTEDPVTGLPRWYCTAQRWAEDLKREIRRKSGSEKGGG